MDKQFKAFVIMAIVVLGIAIAGVSAFVVLSILNNSTVASGDGKNSNTKMVIVNLGDAITSNIYDEDGEQHIARISISFGVNKSSRQYNQFNKDFANQKVVIRDQIISSLREQTYEMMSKSDAQAKLGDDIIVRINELLDTDVIKEVYFSDFFVQ